jgi:glycosyltransferase involved in cell wall biosynthesis
MPTVSVVIPTCARAEWLARAVASVRAQAQAPLEIVVVDDAAGHAPVDRRRLGGDVRVLVNTHAPGASGARNAGAAAARGELLAFLDDDDEWLPSYLARAVALMQWAGLDAVCTDLMYRYADGERRGKRAADALHVDAFLTRNPGLIGSNLLIRRATYLAIGGFDETLRTSEDMDFGLRLSLHEGVRYAPLHVPLVRHYQHTARRLCTRRGAAMRAGIRRFYELHGTRMSEAQRAEFRESVRRLWGIDEFGADQEPPQ